LHELSVTENILKITLQHTPPGQRVAEIHLVIGQLASIVDESVQFYWDMISENTPAQGAQLCFKRVPAVLKCQACQHEFGFTGDQFTCPVCSSPQIKVVRGEEFFVEAIEVHG
jgi:hydrogenase nickel incorporation protein HypA/HybF